jgi:hypothetical protein
MGFSFNISFGKQPISVERDESGSWFYEMWNSTLNRTKLLTYDQKLKAVIFNPACMKVAKLNADLGSLVHVNSYKPNGDIDIENALYFKNKRPNPYQTWTQFFWDYYFWQFIGTSIMRSTDTLYNENTFYYWLDLSRIDFEDGSKRFGKMLMSGKSYQDQQKETIKYKHYDGTVERIPLSQLKFFYDTTNGIGGNWYEGLSTIDSLYKVIQNSEQALDAKGINLEFSQKFMVSQAKESLTDVNMSQDEKRDIESTMRGKKSVHAIKKPIDIKRFVDDLNRLKLDEAFYNDYFMIGTMRGVPRDVLEANLRGSTYENQEKATARHVEYSLKPAGQNLTDEFEIIFQYEELRPEWSHLMFNQVFEKERQEVLQLKLQNEQLARELGIDINKL